MSSAPARPASYDRALPGPVDGPAPERRPDSIRRTSHLDSTRGDGTGFMGVSRVAGGPADLLTTDAGPQDPQRGVDVVVGIDPNGLIDHVAGRPRRCSWTGCSPPGSASGCRLRGRTRRLATCRERCSVSSSTMCSGSAGALGSSASVAEHVLLRSARPPGYPKVRVPAATQTPTSAPAGGRAACHDPARGRAADRRRGGAADRCRTSPEVTPWPEHDMGPLGARRSRRVRRLDLWREGRVLMVDGDLSRHHGRPRSESRVSCTSTRSAPASTPPRSWCSRSRRSRAHCPFRRLSARRRQRAAHRGTTRRGLPRVGSDPQRRPGLLYPPQRCDAMPGRRRRPRGSLAPLSGDLG